MRVSIIIPACDAEATLPRTLESLLKQSDAQWEAVIVADDLKDYRAFLDGKGLNDPRFRFASTGKVRSGCHHARNIGFEAVTGDYVTQLDADDEFTPTRLEELKPLAARHGAAADNLLMIDDATEARIGTVLTATKETQYLSLAAFMTLNAPLVPLIRRDHVLKRVEGIEFSEDVIANIQLIDRIDTLPVTASSSYIYRIRQGSVANHDASIEKFETAYRDYIARLETGDGFGLKPDHIIIAKDGLIAKRALNRAYADAVKMTPSLTFSEFAQSEFAQRART